MPDHWAIIHVSYMDNIVRLQQNELNFLSFRSILYVARMPGIRARSDSPPNGFKAIVGLWKQPTEGGINNEVWPYDSYCVTSRVIRDDYLSHPLAGGVDIGSTRHEYRIRLDICHDAPAGCDEQHSREPEDSNEFNVSFSF